MSQLSTPASEPSVHGAAAPAASTLMKSTPAGGSGLTRWLREPLLHFLVLGGLLFGLDHLIQSDADNPRLIVMDAAVDREARDTFREARGREPDAKEMAALREVWLSNEVLYREGLAQQLYRGDPAIRERVIFKALTMVDGDLKAPVPKEAELQAWFDANRSRYDEPARFDFQEAIVEGRNEALDEAGARALVAAVESGTPGTVQAGLRIFKGRPHGNLVQSYGEPFARALESAAPGRWQALQSREGWRVVRLDGITPARQAEFAAFRAAALQDWVDQTMAERRSAAIRGLADKYTVRREVQP